MILITGANGQLGKDVESICKMRVIDFISTDTKTMDITDKNQIYSIFKQYSISSVIHCAAYTAVPINEILDDPDRLLRGLEAPDDLHELHDRHRAEEMQPRDLVRPFRRRRQLRDGDGRRVAGEDDLGGAEPLKLSEEV